MSDKTVEDWEAPFHGIELPETVQLGPGVFINNINGFLEKSFGILRGGLIRVSAPVEWRVQKLLDIVSEANNIKK